VIVGNGSGHSVEVAQAQGMVAEQADCTLDEALVLMNARARTSHLTMQQIAAEGIHHLIWFDE
jgi:hypothetical protein